MSFLLMMPRIPLNNDMPPTIYSILESIVNYCKDDKTKIKDLAKIGRTTIFNFDYPLSEKVKKEDFECMILNRFLMRRIGFDTVTAFRIQLNVKLNEIMPIYNKMFDVLDGWNIFEDGETITHDLESNRKTDNTNETNNSLKNTSDTTNKTISDRRNSELPQNQLQDLRDGNYVTDYNYDTLNANDTNNTANTSNITDAGTVNERITRSPADKIKIYKEFMENRQSIMTMIFKDLDCLFYGLA